MNEDSFRIGRLGIFSRSRKVGMSSLAHPKKKKGQLMSRIKL